MKKNAVAIIPARSGSKRIPNKNIRPFFGKPVIQYAIELAKSTGLFDDIIVSTDSTEIKEIAEQAGAQVPWMRSAKNSDDFATTQDVLEEVLQNLLGEGRQYTYGCCIYPVSPLARPDDIQKAYGYIRQKEWNTVFPVCAFSYPIWRSLRMNEDGSVQATFPQAMSKRSQDLETIYHDAGQWYWFKTGEMSGGLIGERSKGIVLPASRVQDVDNEVDWQLLELKFQRIDEQSLTQFDLE